MIVKRQGNNPKRRLAPASSLDEQVLKALASKVSYAGSGHHKRYPADYGLERTNPRPTKSLCDLVKAITVKQAWQLLATGIKAGMVSGLSKEGFPKFIWCVDEDEIVYEAKTDVRASGAYHGYPLEAEDDFRRYILAEWKKRCR
ncbi:hypothetical protein [Inquilinus sp. CAU 1745]|uniref:hypothetical protein n=1 Tax=Inquilinus sp. CAU 1745 TaxID=3140369 RepID=UPI00325AB410